MHGGFAAEAGLEPRVGGRAEETEGDGEKGEDDERSGHDRGVFLRVFGGVAARMAKERFCHQAGVVERGENDTHQCGVKGEVGTGSGVRGVEDSFLAPKTGEEQRHADEGHRTDGERSEGELHLHRKSAELTDVLLVVRGVNDGTGTEEEQRFEKRVSEQVEDRGARRTHTDREHHVAELGDGGESEDAFEIILGDRDGRSEEGGDGSDDGDHLQRVGREQRINARHEEHARGDHRSSVDEGGDWRRTFHRVGQPDVERELAGFADGTAKEEQADGAGDGEAADRCSGTERAEDGGFEDAVTVVVKEERTGRIVEPEAEQEPEVADARGDEGFFRGVGGGRFVKPETDEQIGGETDEFPADEHEQETIGDEQAEHRRGEETQEAEELFKVLIFLHVAEAENEDERADERHHRAHERGERVEQPTEAHGIVAEFEPGEVVREVRGGIRESRAECGAGNEERQDEGDDRGTRDELTTAAGRERADGCGDERQRRDDPKVLSGKAHGMSMTKAK